LKVEEEKGEKKWRGGEERKKRRSRGRKISFAFYRTKEERAEGRGGRGGGEGRRRGRRGGTVCSEEDLR
jgi:hypothetical protein